MVCSEFKGDSIQIKVEFLTGPRTAFESLSNWEYLFSTSACGWHSRPAGMNHPLVVVLALGLKRYSSEISCNDSSTVGSGCFSLRIARFACLISKQMPMSPLGFSTQTSGLIQLVGPLTFSMTYSSSHCFSFAVTFCLLLNGIRRRGCAIGGMLPSCCNFS